jgi:dihydroorotase-like cyclic amidohydrolase
VEAIEHLRSRGVRVYAEVCIHHLTMTVNEAQDKHGFLAKVNPPLRSQKDIDALWDAVQRGVIDTIGTDHVAHTRAKAKPSLWEVMPGFSGTATMLPALLSEGYHKRGIPLNRIVSLTSHKASTIFNLKEKGSIRIGADADLTLIDLDLERTDHADDLLSVSDYNLHQGRKLKGWPTLVILRGQVAMLDGEIKVQPGYGRFIRRTG